MPHDSQDLSVLTNSNALDSSELINPRCKLHARDGATVVVVSGASIAFFRDGDEGGRAYAQVLLVSQGWADQNDVARAFGCSARTVRRHQRVFEKEGLAGLGRSVGYPKGRARVAVSQEEAVLQRKMRGEATAAIAQAIGVTDVTVRAILKRRGWQPPTDAQMELSTGEPERLGAGLPSGPSTGESERAAETAEDTAGAAAESEEEAIGFTLDSDPSDRVMDRLAASRGLLSDALPLFRVGADVGQLGVLLAVPALVEGRVFQIAREVYGSLGAAFYGLRTTILTLVLMALVRIKRAEGLKERSPEDLGRLLGLDRAPEVKTLRRKLSALARLGRAEEFGRALAAERVAQRDEVMGLVYVDGHVRAYHGQHEIPKTHVARLGRILAGTTDYWVHDAGAEPLLVVTSEANAGLVAMLPKLVEQVRSVIGDRELTVVFDRGGYSPKLFRQLLAANRKVQVLTYRKGHWRPLPVRRFVRYEGTVDGRRVAYDLADGEVVVGGLRMRQVTRRTADGHQTPILTSRRDLPALEVAARMFGRWRQENFFKYLREEFALDGLVEYATRAADPERTIPNPARRPVEEKLSKARAALQALEADYGRAAEKNPERRRPSIRGFKIANGATGRRVREARQAVRALEAERAALPGRVAVGETVQAVVKLAPERQHLTNVLKTVAYQVESELLGIVERHYRRSQDEGRTLVQTILNTSGELRVEEGCLHVILAPLSSPHRTAILEALCSEMTTRQVRFPGTQLQMKFHVRDGVAAVA